MTAIIVGFDKRHTSVMMIKIIIAIRFGDSHAMQAFHLQAVLTQ